MIGSLRGSITDVETSGNVLLDVHGVGYRVQTTAATALLLSGMHSEVLMQIHTHVREDAIVLYGFLEVGERRAFETLLAAHGVGPSLALGILGTLTVDDLAAAISSDDADRLTVVPGVGKKTAQRLVLELKDRFIVGTPSVPTLERPQAGSVRDEVSTALEGLGFSKIESAEAVEHLSEELSVEAALRVALKQLAIR
ncbi:MAG: Holliday junction branch migration protein RuvA [Actinomycetota bacterium]